MFDKIIPRNEEEMTAAYLDDHIKDDNMSLYRDLKLKRRKVVDGVFVSDLRCCGDGETIIENNPRSPDSISPDSGSPESISPESGSPESGSPDSGGSISPPHESYCSPELVRHSTGISSRERIRLLNDSRISPDSGGYNYSEERSIDQHRSHPRIYDGGGDAFVSSTPMMMMDSQTSMDNYDDMSISPPPPCTSIDRKVGIQSTIHIAPLYQGTDEGCSLGAGGTSHGIMASVSPMHHRTSPPASHIWTNGNNGSTFVDHRELRKLSIKPKQRGSRASVVKDTETVQSMIWAMAGHQNGHSPNPFACAPREVINSPRRYDTSDAVRVSVDGLLSLGQDRKSPIQISRSPPMRSPYSPSPSPSHYNSVVRVSSSGELQTMTPSSSSSSSSFLYTQQPQHSPLNMERLWAGESVHSIRPPPKNESALDLSKVDMWNGSAAVDSSGVPMTEEIEEQDQPMICMICEDKATGLHYGIITCEGCKGFFKRTVQNKRIYQCIADEECEVTKSQRNRCQFCRFKKCLDRGMVLAAVREDRMPGGRNSGAVYNLYKVKYKKKNKNKNVNGRARANTPDKIANLPGGYETSFLINGGPLGPQANTSHSSSMSVVSMNSHSSSLVSGPLGNGNILKTALTNPSEIAHLRHRDSLVSSTRPRHMSLEIANSFIHGILKIEDSSDLAMVNGVDKLLNQSYTTIKEKLERISDHVGSKLVQWAKSLPFYQGEQEHAELLTSTWHNLIILSAATHQSMYCGNKLSSQAALGDIQAECNLETTKHMYHLRHVECVLRDDTNPEIREDIHKLIEKFSEVVVSLRRLNIQMEEYVCLKVITLLAGSKRRDKDFYHMREQYTECLRYFCESRYPSQRNRVQEVLVKLVEIQDAADLLVSTKAFYVPIMMCWNVDR